MTDPGSSELPPTSSSVAGDSFTDRPRWQLRSAALAGGAVVATVVWLLAVPIGGTDLEVTVPNGDLQELRLRDVAGAAVVQPLIGWLVLALMERTLARARTAWLVLVVVVLVILGFNAAASAENTATAIWLNVMHLAVSAATVPVLAATSPRS